MDSDVKCPLPRHCVLGLRCSDFSKTPQAFSEMSVYLLSFVFHFSERFIVGLYLWLSWLLEFLWSCNTSNENKLIGKRWKHLLKRPSDCRFCLSCITLNKSLAGFIKTYWVISQYYTRLSGDQIRSIAILMTAIGLQAQLHIQTHLFPTGAGEPPSYNLFPKESVPHLGILHPQRGRGGRGKRGDDTMVT